MKKAILFISAVLILAGCQTAEQQAKADNADKNWCTSNGSPSGAALTNCMLAREQQRQSDRQARAAAFARFGQQLNQVNQQYVPVTRPTTTNCRRVGNMVQCTTL